MESRGCGSICINTGQGWNCSSTCHEHIGVEHDHTAGEASYGGRSNTTGKANIAEVKKKVNNPPRYVETKTKEVLSAADALIKAAKEISMRVTIESDVNKFHLAVLTALGLALLPEEIIIATGGVLTALAIGPLAEGMSLEVMANEAFMYAASRAGAVLANGKYLNLFGIFTTATVTKIFTASEHPCLGMTVEQVAEKAITLGVKSLPNTLILWSGFKEYGVIVSQNFAKANGGVTLEMLEGGKWLHEMGLFKEGSPFTIAEALAIWEKVSLKAIDEAEGIVRAVLGNVTETSVYLKEKAAVENSTKTTLIELELLPKTTLKIR